MSSPERPTDDPDTVDTLAAEFVLGTLDRGARLDVEDRRAVDALLDERVRWWEQRLQPLALTVPAAIPSLECQRRIVRRVRRRAAEQALAAPVAGAVDDAPAAKSVRPSRVGAIDRAAARRLSSGEEPAALSRWRAFAIAASLTALALSVLVVGGVGVPPAGEQASSIAAVAVDADMPPDGASEDAVAGAEGESLVVSERTALSLLRDGDGQPRFIVEIRADDSVSITALDREPATEDGSLQLWMADGVSGELRAVGLLPSDPWSSVRVDPIELFDREPAFAVSVEPPGGSPQAGPTGDVVFQGSIHPIGDGR